MQVAGVRCNTVTAQYVSAERIVCDMAEALLPHSPGGPVELCIGVCSADFRTLSTQTYSFVVSTTGNGLMGKFVSVCISPPPAPFCPSSLFPVLFSPSFSSYYFPHYSFFSPPIPSCFLPPTPPPTHLYFLSFFPSSSSYCYSCPFCSASSSYLPPFLLIFLLLPPLSTPSLPPLSHTTTTPPSPFSLSFSSSSTSHSHPSSITPSHHPHLPPLPLLPEPLLRQGPARKGSGLRGHQVDGDGPPPGRWQQRQCFYREGGVSLCQVSAAATAASSHNRKHNSKHLVNSGSTLLPPSSSSRRTNREIVCITPGSQSGPGPASIRLMIDRAEVTNPDTKYSYSEDPTISGVEPSWTILKYWTIPAQLDPGAIRAQKLTMRVCLCVCPQRQHGDHGDGNQPVDYPGAQSPSQVRRCGDCQREQHLVSLLKGRRPHLVSTSIENLWGSLPLPCLSPVLHCRQRQHHDLSGSGPHLRQATPTRGGAAPRRVWLHLRPGSCTHAHTDAHTDAQTHADALDVTSSGLLPAGPELHPLHPLPQPDL